MDVFDAACAAWLPHTLLGIDPLVRTAARGHGCMHPCAGKASLTDAELRSTPAKSSTRNS